MYTRVPLRIVARPLTARIRAGSAMGSCDRRASIFDVSLGCVAHRGRKIPIHVDWVDPLGIDPSSHIESW